MYVIRSRCSDVDPRIDLHDEQDLRRRDLCASRRNKLTTTMLLQLEPGHFQGRSSLFISELTKSCLSMTASAVNRATLVVRSPVAVRGSNLPLPTDHCFHIYDGPWDSQR